MCQPPYSVLKPLRYKVGGPSEVYASFLCGMGPQGENLLKNGCVGCDHRDKMDVALSNLLIACRFSTIFLVFSIKKRIFWQIYEQYKGDLIMMLGINAKR